MHHLCEIVVQTLSCYTVWHIGITGLRLLRPGTALVLHWVAFGETSSEKVPSCHSYNSCDSTGMLTPPLRQRLELILRVEVIQVTRKA